MAFLADLSMRRLQPEWMDQPDLDGAAHRQALNGLQRINVVSRSVSIVWRPIEALAKTSHRPLRILDLASGGGDVVIGVACAARDAGLSVECIGLDVSEVAVDHAREAAKRRGVDCRFFRVDALRAPLPEDCDVVMCSLFLHHLAEKDAVRLLKKMAAATRSLVLVNDLIRCRLGWLLAQAGTRLLSRSPVVHVDGPRSVEGAFSLDEIRDLAGRAGFTEFDLERRWPCRFLLSWSKR